MLDGEPAVPKPAPAAAGRARHSASAAALIAVTLLVSGCGWFGGSKVLLTVVLVAVVVLLAGPALELTR